MTTTILLIVHDLFLHNVNWSISVNRYLHYCIVIYIAYNGNSIIRHNNR